MLPLDYRLLNKYAYWDGKKQNKTCFKGIKTNILVLSSIYEIDREFQTIYFFLGCRKWWLFDNYY